MSSPVQANTLPHGGNIEEMAKLWNCKTSDILDLSTGLHPLGPPQWLNEWLKDNASLVAHYPDRNGEPARSALAEFLGVKPENILILAGAQAAIEILPQALGWNSMAIRQPCYSEPIRAAKRVNCQIIPVTMNEAWPENTDCIWLTSPHNPHGNKETFPQNRHGVLDESYMPFVERQQLGMLPDVIRLGSLTKTFCIPGLRLGYIVAEPTLIQQIQAWLPPWPASTLAIHLLPKLLQDATHRDEKNVVLRKRMLSLLKQYKWKTKPSLAGFVLARPANHLPDFAVERILVRTFDEWGVLDGWVRFGLPILESDWQRLEQVLQQSELP